MSQLVEAAPVTTDIGRLKASRWEGVRALASLLRPYRWWAVAFVALGVAASLLETVGVSLLLPILEALLRPAVETVTSTGNVLLDLFNRLFSGVPPAQRLQAMLLAMLALIVVKNLMNYRLATWAARLQFRVERDVSLSVFDQFTRVGLRWLTGQSTGDLLTLLTIEPERTGLAARDGLQLIVLGCLIAGYGALLLLISWPLTLLTGAMLAALSLVLRLPGYAAINLGGEVTRLAPHLSQVRVETLQGMRLVRAYGRAAYERERFKQLLDRMARLRIRAASLSNLPAPLAEVAGSALLVGLITIASRLVMAQRELVGPLLLAFFFVLYRLLPRVSQLHTLWVNLAFHLAGACAVKRVLETSDKPYLASGSRAFEQLREGIELQQVQFTYDPAEGPVLHEVTMTVPKGQVTAIIGVSGVGKSTLVDLLLRFHDPDAGAVLVDGVDVRQLNLETWRRAISVVSQDIVVFHASICDNIGYSKPGASHEEIVQAARRAHAHEFIQGLKHGYDTVVGDRGIRLSAGQRQRIAIARAILRDPQVLILDEATSALDSESEWYIQRALEELSASRTVLMIAHRLSTVARANHIVVLQDGKVLERGTHESLMARESRYRKLWRLQAVESELPTEAPA
ncbi:MAG: ABC transporter [Candidatus Omnitrophica bacterium CG11_big_fil_rev_8_21_14_0_20_63_9]|nr:MAG: ABC transporter [Candidatus Omnitrophica bacterium CG11_big_fil_rev_8_21_14_0_20_63_9]